jgi:hypothetical protein
MGCGCKNKKVKTITEEEKENKIKEAMKTFSEFKEKNSNEDK